MLLLSAKYARPRGRWKTLDERRFGEPFKGLTIPFGSMVEYHPVSARELSRLHQFGPKVMPGKFLGYALYPVRIWKGDMLVADIEELEQMDASEIYTKKTQEREKERKEKEAEGEAAGSRNIAVECQIARAVVAQVLAALSLERLRPRWSVDLTRL